jgi:hypothetical protein
MTPTDQCGAVDCRRRADPLAKIRTVAATDTTPPSAGTDMTRSPASRTGLDLLLLTGLAVVLRLPAFVAARHLTFDDGVFGASAVAMRDGASPFADVFSSQGPLFLPLVRLADIVGFEGLNAPRLLALFSGVTITLGVYLIGRRISDRLGAWVAAGLATTAGSLAWVTGPLAADGPSIAFATFAFYFTLRYRDSGRLPDAALIGLFVGGALSTKLTSAPVMVPVVVVLAAPLLGGLRRRQMDGVRLIGLATAAMVAIVVYAGPALFFGLADVWDQSVLYHQQAAGGRDLIANGRKILSTVADRDLPLIVFGAVTVGLALAASRRGGTTRAMTSSARPGSARLLGLWLGTTGVLLLYIHPLWRPHLSGLIVPAALLVGMYRPPAKIVAIVALLCVPLQAVRMNDYLVPSNYSDATTELQVIFERLPADAQIISDDPGHVWRAGRRTPDDLVDPSILRIESGRITSDSLAEAADDEQVCAVVVWSSVRFGSFDDLAEQLAAIGYVPTSLGGHRVIYVRDDCG